MGLEIVHIIHDNRLLDRKEPLVAEMARQGIAYKLWEPIEDIHSVVRSINLSHKQIVAWAKKAGQKEVIIMEDDVMFPAADGFQFFLNNKPESFDLYLGCTYLVPVSQNQICGFHCYMVHGSFYDTFLGVPDNVHIDTIMNKYATNRQFCYPFPALQRAGWSANNREKVNYNSVLEEKDIYWGETTVHNI